MDAVGLLVHDHEVLTAHVEHVSALIYGIAGHAFDVDLVFPEFRRQILVLCDEVAAHFRFEEEVAFPKLTQVLPELAPMLMTLEKAHGRIILELAHLCELVASAHLDFTSTLRPLAQVFERFATSYRSHLREETDILAALEAKLGDVDLDGLAEIGEGLTRKGAPD